MPKITDKAAAKRLGKLRAKSLTTEHQQRSAEKRWGDPHAREKASERMRKFWTGWRQAKEEARKKKDKEISESAKRGFLLN